MIDVEQLTIAFRLRNGVFRAIRDCDLHVGSGEALAVVGESGSGKTTVARAVMGDIASNAVVESGSVRIAGNDVFAASPQELAALRRFQLGYVPQNPGASLNPVRRIGVQICEITGGRSAGVGALLERVELSLGLARRYPYQLSGGQQQRAALAIALANDPKALILDEPTTGLDVRVQASVLRLVRSIVDEGLAVLYVTHDLAAAAMIADRVLVMYAGTVVEEGALEEVYRGPLHPYSAALLHAVPTVTVRSKLVGIPGQMLGAGQRDDCCVFHNRCAFAIDACRTAEPAMRLLGERRSRCLRVDELQLRGVPEAGEIADLGAALAAEREVTPALEINDLTVRYGSARGATPPAVNDVSLALADGETLAVVGESGSGKTSLARAVVGLVEPAAGAVLLRGVRLASTLRTRPREQRREIQYIFQNPTLALNPRHTIERILRAPLTVFFSLSKEEEDTRIRELMTQVGLPHRLLAARPRRLSGGEQQRVAIARALAARPRVLICDEVVSALDVSVQASIVELLGRLQEETGISLLFISHDLGVVRSIAHRTAVMSEGVLVELAGTADVFERPQHAYTQMLLEHVPDTAGAGR